MSRTTKAPTKAPAKAPAKAPTATVQIVTVAFGSDAVLPTFLESIRKAAPKHTSTLIVDNAPNVGDSAGLARRFKVSHLPLPSNPGYGGAVNASRQHWPAGPEYVLVANPDVAFTPGSITKLVDAMDRDPSLGAVGPQLQNPDGTVYPSARAFPTLLMGTGHALFHGVWPNNPWTRKYHANNEDVHERDCDWLSGACMLIRTSAFDSIDGFDESFFMYFEDVDLSHRLHQSGWRVRYIPSATITHFGAHSTTQRAAAMKREHHRSAARFVTKRYPAWYHTPLRFVLRLALTLRSLALR